MTEPNQSVVCRVALEETGQTISVAPGTMVLDVLRAAGIDIPAACGGNGTCGQCRVDLSGERLPPPGPAERKHLAPAEQDRGIRLACCTPVHGDLKIRLPKRTLNTGIRLQVDGNQGPFTVDPVIRPIHVKLSPADLDDCTPDVERLFQALEQNHGLKHLTTDHRAAAELSETLRRHDWTLEACLRGRELVAALPPSTPPLGLAVDLGTTKIAGYLMDLTTGETRACAGRLNPQGRFGADIMSRLQHACRTTGPNDLPRVVRQGIERLLQDLVVSAGVNPRQVVDTCIVANTAMVHLLLDLPVRQLARAPYTATTLNGFDIKARDLELGLAPGAWVHILPSIGGFVGADHVAMIMAAGIDHLDRVAIGLDIGTNTEIVLRRPDSPHLYCLSCPSGPAFEGAHVANGMRAAAGAIEEVRFTDALEPTCKTIDHAPAIGLCGSGMIDTMAELFRYGLINTRGRFQNATAAAGNPFLLVPQSESGTGNAIMFSQKDINEIQLAKGAIRAGIEILLDVSQTRREQVEQVVIAGAFGAYINLTNAVEIGLIPNFPSASHHQIGNAAAAGAKQALLDRTARLRAVQISKNTRYIELARHQDFNRHFARGMLLPQGATIVSGEQI